jgi:hypothetical protein
MDKRPMARAPARPLEALEGRVLFSTYTVTGTADVASTAPDYVGTLRWAVAQANAANAPASSPSVIAFASSAFGATPKTITLTQGQLELVRGATTLTGPGASLLALSAGNASRVLQVDAGVTANLSGVTLADGDANGNATTGGVAGAGQGGGVYNAGSLTLADCAVSSSSATAGGGVYNVGSLTRWARAS